MKGDEEEFMKCPCKDMEIDFIANTVDWRCAGYRWTERAFSRDQYYICANIHKEERENIAMNCV